VDGNRIKRGDMSGGKRTSISWRCRKTIFDSEDFSGGLYLNTFSELVFKLDDNLKQVAIKLPANAKYVSSDNQNEVVRCTTINSERPNRK
jgi:helix-turn-helix protein